jgi:hypothetical protein
VIPRRVRLAVLLAGICHGFFIVTARYRFSYDAFTHMFFGDHYAKSWWALWDARWFGGFEVVSYPPLVHQLIGLLSHVLGVDGAYALIQLLVSCAYPLAVYAFSRIFLGRSTSSYAAIGGAFLPSLYYAAYTFGQLPTLTATLFALLGLAAFGDFLYTGNRSSGAAGIALVTVMMAAHHATLLFLPWSIAAIMLHTILTRKVEALVTLKRAFLFGGPAVLGGLLVIWPFWQWGTKQEIQTPIDHLSRHNFIQDPMAFMAFFLPMYGGLIILFPFALKAFKRRYISLALLFLLLFVLGLGGTTPLPKWLFGSGWEWLTYDRFAFWGSLTLLPFLGIFLIHLRRRLPRWFSLKVAVNQARHVRPLLEAGTNINIRKAAVMLTFTVFALVAFMSGSIPLIFHTQPPPVDMKPVVDFLDTAHRSTWRYLTFGFGDQMAYLSRLTEATTMDGSYFTARTHAELRESGIGLIDTAFWSDRGISAIGPILERSDEHGVRWGFVHRREYVPELRKNGWVFVQYLSNGIQVWENPDAVLPNELPSQKDDPLAGFSWGILPLLSMVIAGTLGGLWLWPAPAEKVIRAIHAFLVGLLPIGLGFWYYKMVGEFQHTQVYFIYDHALFFLVDGLALLAVTLWLAVQLQSVRIRVYKFSWTILCLSGLCCLMTISTLWSLDWRTSLYASLHFWLVLGLILSMRDWTENWTPVALGLCAFLAIQAVAGLVTFAMQSTELLDVLGLDWPGLLKPSTRGAIILKLPDGETILRAYGTLPHPNILGGCILFSLLGPIALFLREEMPNRLVLVLLAIGSSLLALTFSRSAWIGTAMLLLMIWHKRKSFAPKRAAIILLVTGVSFGLTLLFLNDLLLSRMSAAASTEEFSVVGRVWLAKQALLFTAENPLSGLGIGTFIIQLARRAGEFNYVEPVHNVPLLALSELGIFGFILVIAIVVTIGLKFSRYQKPNAHIIGGILIGLGFISLLDHYMWTLAPGRIMLGLVLGLWEMQTKGTETSFQLTDLFSQKNKTSKEPPWQEPRGLPDHPDPAIGV